MTEKIPYEKLLQELDKSLIVDQITSNYWQTNYQKLPASAVNLFYERLVQEDAKIDQNIAAGIDANPELAEQIKAKGQTSARKLLRFQEEESREEENPEDFLKQNL